MRPSWLGIGQQHSVMPARGPAAHHGVSHVRVKLQRIGRPAVAEGLHREGIALCEQVRTERKVEPLAMPLVDLLRPGIADAASELSGPDRIVSNLGVTVRMPVHAAAEMMRQHLRAETDAEKRLLLTQRHREPVDLAPDEIVGVVRAHRAPEDDGGCVLGHAVGKSIAKARAARIERIAAVGQRMTDTPRGRGLLMQHDQNRRAHGAVRMPDSMTAAAPRHKMHGAHGRHTPGAWEARSFIIECMILLRSARGTMPANAATALLARPGTTSGRPALSPR